MSAASIIEHFSALPDPRAHARKNEHNFIDIIVIAVCAVICGADNWTEITQTRCCEKGLVRCFFGTAERHPFA